MIKVSNIDWHGDFRLQFVFSDGSIGEHDFADLVAEEGPMVEPLRQRDYFKRVFLEDGAPTWPNGFDLAPAWLHRMIQDAGALRRTAAA